MKEIEINGYRCPSRIASKSPRKRIFVVPPLAKVGEGLKTKKRLIGDSGSKSKEVLVEDKVELSGQGEVTSREALVSHQNGADGGAGEAVLCLENSAAEAKPKAKRIWRKHVPMILVSGLLDFVVCLILFSIWLVVCHGFQCID